MHSPYLIENINLAIVGSWLISHFHSSPKEVQCFYFISSMKVVVTDFSLIITLVGEVDLLSRT